MNAINFALILVGPFVVVFGIESIVNRHVLGDSMRHPFRTTAAGFRLTVAALRRAVRAVGARLACLVHAVDVYRADMTARRRAWERSRGAALPGPGQPGYEARVRALLTAPEWPVDRERAGGVR